MLFYVTIGSNELDRAKLFYDALFDSIGIARNLDLVKGGACWGFGADKNGQCETMFTVLSPLNGEPATVGNGTMIGLRLDTPEQVDRIHSRALELGGTSEGDPGLRQTNVPGTYIAYFRDLEGNKFAVMTSVGAEVVESGHLREIR